MGLEEQLIEIFTNRGIQEGVQQAKEVFVRNLIIKMGLSNKQIADLTGTSISFVKKIRLAQQKFA